MGGRKAELLKKSEKARAKVLQLKHKEQALEKSYENLLLELQPQIDKLQNQAEELGPKFRNLYRASQEAYSDQDGALAKSLSIQGHEIEDSCRAINNRANELRKRLKNKYDKINKMHQEAEQSEKLVVEYKSKADALRKTKVTNFTDSKVMTEYEVEEFLDEFPQKIFNNIDSIRYFDEIVIEEDGICFGKTTWNKETNKATIDIFKHTNKTFLRETITHEIGHCIFLSLMNEEQRLGWGSLYKQRFFSKDFITKCASESRGEDFCECFICYKLQPDKLEKLYNVEYDFIDKLYNSL